MFSTPLSPVCVSSLILKLQGSSRHQSNISLAAHFGESQQHAADTRIGSHSSMCILMLSRPPLLLHSQGSMLHVAQSYTTASKMIIYNIDWVSQLQEACVLSPLQNACFSQTLKAGTTLSAVIVVLPPPLHPRVHKAYGIIIGQLRRGECTHIHAL